MATYAITGTNRGIGLELTRQALAAGHRVLALCRTASDDLRATGAEIHEGIDVADDAVIATLGERLGSERIDILINNAGLLRRQTLQDLDMDGMRRQFEINTLGPLRVTKGLLGCLSEGSKIAIVTSRMGSIADNTSGGSYGYRMSKTAVNMAGVSLAHDLRDQGIAVLLVHPGFVRTEMTGGNGMIDAQESAAGILARIDGHTLEKTGTFWHQNGEALPW
jgi:NAD(P)-dependent dehydrogenase (short-subunit alcohol dehydrogenase family)